MTFSELNINKPLLNALDDIGYSTPTTIQEKAFPVIMSGQDVIGIAQTGTGKTLAFLLPSLRLWKFSKEKDPQILIIVPTRELVTQVVETVEKLTAYMNVVVVGVYGGTNINTQAAIVEQGLDVLVGTPGRLYDLVLRRSVKLKSIKRFVIDEVDEMLDLGFRTQITRILDLLPPKTQNLMFSATITEDVENMIETYFNNPLRIEAAPTGTPLEKIIQKGFLVPNFNTKVNLLKYLLKQDPEMKKVLIFTSSKRMADQLFEEIETEFAGELGVIHSNKSQNLRFATVNSFKEGKIRALIATDIISRGIDIAEVSHVINFDIPEEAESYIHRIGRTGRADKDGIAITFITEKDAENQAKIEDLMNKKIPMEVLPEEVEISDVLTEDEMPKISMKEVVIKLPSIEAAGPAFHEKKDKNKKVNKKVRRQEQMRLKYGKPKTRGQKPNKKKK